MGCLNPLWFYVNLKGMNMSQHDSNESIRHQIESQLNWRYATKLFDKSKKILEVDLHTLTESLRLSASSFGLQPWCFVVAQSEDMKAKLSAAAPMNKAKFETASHIVIFANKKTMTPEYVDSYIQVISETRGVPLSALQDFRNIMLNKVQGMTAEALTQWTARQTYIAMGGLITAAAMLGIDTCAMEGIDAAQFDQILGLSATGHGTLAAVALGYRSAEDTLQSAKKVRFAADQIIRIV